MPRRALPLLVLVCAAWLLLARQASAHAVGVSRGEYRAEDGAVRALYVFSSAELAVTLPIDHDHDGVLSASEVATATTTLDQEIVGATTVELGGVPCAPHLDSASLERADAVTLHATFTCDRAPASPPTLSVEAGFLSRFSADHRHLASLQLRGGGSASLVATFAQPYVETFATTAASPAPSFAAMVWTGIVHILSGYDHLAFLLGLLLLGGRPRALIGIVTAFTVAHSITLALAALRLVTPPGAIIEPLIAVSIAYVGIENLFAKDGSKRWRIAFPFGLLHGFGFAGALLALDLPRVQLPAALFAFNLGVELGQLGVLAVVLPLVTLARTREEFRTWGVKGLSAGIACAGAIWFFARVAG
jgi:hypothetical protein